MKKLKIILVIILAVVLGGVCVLRFWGPSDVIVLTEEEEAKYKQAKIEQFKNIDLAGFKTKDLNGKDVSSDIFSKHKVTMVNIWSTWCGPCIEEMPEIGKLYEDLPEGANIISICTDAGESEKTLSLAKKIMKKSNANFVALIPDEFLKTNLTDDIQALPTTIFIDSEGKVIGEPHFDEQTAEAYSNSINERLKMIEENQ